MYINARPDSGGGGGDGAGGGGGTEAEVAAEWQRRQCRGWQDGRKGFKIGDTKGIAGRVIKGRIGDTTKGRGWYGLRKGLKKKSHSYWKGTEELKERVQKGFKKG